MQSNKSTIPDQTTSAVCSSVGRNSSSVPYDTAWPDTRTRDRPVTVY